MGQAPEGRRLTDPGFSAASPFGAFGPDELLNCYATGVFPMGEGRDDPRVFLVEPYARGIIPLDGFHIPTRLRRTVRGEPFQVRVDSGVYQGYKIPPYYDSLIGKLIVHGRNRVECMMRLRRALDEFVVDGIHTTIPLFRQLVDDQDIADGRYDIHWLEKKLAVDQ